jgi:hypothetical protein
VGQDDDVGVEAREMIAMPKKSGRSNRRAGSPLNAGRPFERTSCAPRSLSAAVAYRRRHVENEHLLNWLSTKITCLVLAMSVASCAANHPVVPTDQSSARQGTYEVLTNAINREDWNGLRGLAKDGMRADDHIRNWEKNPVRVGKLISVEKTSKYDLEGKPCTTYSFALGFKDGRQNPHWLQVLVQDEGGQSAILDFWEFGW